MIQIQVVSDIHLEFYNTTRKTPAKYIIPIAPILFLAGDIGYPGSSLYKDFMVDMSSKFDHIFVITGNHEYYSTSARKWSMAKTDEYMENLFTDLPNIHFLQNKSYYLTGYDDKTYKILGTTLWTSIKDKYAAKIQYFMNDYHKIPGLNTSFTTQLHDTAVTWLKEEFKEDIPTIVVTHHCPSLSPHATPTNATPELQSAYQTDLEGIIPPHVIMWIYGHTHQFADFTASNNSTRIISNPFGYKGEFPSSYMEDVGTTVYDA